MNFENPQDNQYELHEPARTRRIPLLLGLAGIAFGALSFGFVVVTALAGGSSTPASTDTPPPPPETIVPPGATTTTPPSGSTQPPSPTQVPPTATPIPLTPTPTVPPITSPKFHDIFRAEGGTVSKSASSALPLRRLEAGWNNSYISCPAPTCIRGRASVMAGVGPLAIGESPVASAMVYNTFVAQRADANLLMDLRWKGSLAAVVGVNVSTGVEIEVIVSELDRKTNKVVKAVPNMPFSVLSEELGLEAITGVDVLQVEDSRSLNIPLKLDPGHLYRIDLKITCSTRAAFSASATTCSFYAADGFAGVEWTKQVVEYDTGICSPTQKGNGCIYQKN